MDPLAIEDHFLYLRTLEGDDEASRPRRGLSTSALRVLRKIDGEKRVGELGAFVRSFELPAILIELETQLLIECRNSPNAAEQKDAKAHLDDAKAQIRGLLRREMGEAGPVWEARVADCVSLNVLRRVLREAVEQATTRHGQAAAQRVLAGIKLALGSIQQEKGDTRS